MPLPTTCRPFRSVAAADLAQSCRDWLAATPDAAGAARVLALQAIAESVPHGGRVSLSPADWELLRGPLSVVTLP